jgi:hypothetical protein
METTMSKSVAPTEAAEAAAPPSDRRLVLKASLATMAALGAGIVPTLAAAAEKGAGLSDANILNFALNLEYLEAEFYLRAVTGQGLSASEKTGTGKQGSVNGGRKVAFRNSHIAAYAAEIAADEKAHVDFLRTALGASAVAEPSIDFTKAFNTLAQAAGLGDTFDPFVDDDSFLIGAFVFEDVGVTAYHGAARYINNKDYLDAAAGILAVEAYHAGLIRTVMYERHLAEPAAKISQLREKLSKGFGSKAETDQQIAMHAVPNIIPADPNGLAFERSTDQVLNIVYAGGASGAFGFFPEKVNGAIR